MSLIHKIALSLIKNAGPVLAKSMLAYAGSAEKVFEMLPNRLDRIPGIGPKRLEMFDFKAALERAEQEITFIERQGIDVLFYTDPGYPKRLKLCHDAPVLLYAKGKMDLNRPRIVSIIGTRNPTEYGRHLCRELIEGLKDYGVLVISGLAHGIDVAAHKESLKHNVQTVGVLGHGLQQIYPHVNKGTADKMLLNGGILTEYPSGTTPDRENFPSRNRIVAGIADATIVIEANMKSGTLITAEIANSYNRDVFAFPGRINDEFSEGCNFLIRNHKASLLTSAADVAYILGWDKDASTAQKPSQLSLAMDLTADERQIMELLRIDQGIAIDELTLKAGMPVSQLTMNLLNLEMQGFIRSMPGKTYALN